MDANIEYLADLASRLDELKQKIADGNLGGMTGGEMQLFLEQLRDVYALLESELQKLADEIEKNGGTKG
ncbi:MAG: hypothetical protein KA369_09075 [Spirochaetes bacterium]|nr:hypothetical protein [Spirochaetota bacterium]